MARRRRGGDRAVQLHADAQRLLAEADYPPTVKQTILMALRGGRPGKQQCVVCGTKTVQHCQLWVPRELTQAVPDLTAKPVVYWLCATHYGQVSQEALGALLAQQGRGRKGTRAGLPQQRGGGGTGRAPGWTSGSCRSAEGIEGEGTHTPPR